MWTANLKDLDRLPGQVRADYLRIVERMLAEVPAHWESRLSIPVLWLTLGTAGGDDVQVERVDVPGLYKQNGYADDFRFWVESAVRSRVSETGARCAALVCHGGMSSPVQSPLLRALTGPPDRDAFLHAVHRDGPRAFRDSFPIRRGPLRRARFAPEVHEKLAEARRRWPDRTDSRRG